MEHTPAFPALPLGPLKHHLLEEPGTRAIYKSPQPMMPRLQR